ncbi:hypothetical protein GIS00_14365 [Nakamurella sp. YIM 132087]|uniref:DUF3558 domain-containing protein n=1 Tax=Nakamurella alba TaxID=2665158 RepID=A0A7K1FQR5_9ACTN|nr:hypothetical protein [Nakamurella alba]MTD15124.1 hypothetical protein [Nakamurella alba]
MRRLLPALLLVATALLAGCTTEGSATRAAAVERELDETASACIYLPDTVVTRALPNVGFGVTPPGQPTECGYFGEDRLLTLFITFDATPDGVSRADYSAEQFGTIDEWEQLGKTRPEQTPVDGIGNPAVMWNDPGSEGAGSGVLVVEWFHASASVKLVYPYPTTETSGSPDVEPSVLVGLAQQVRQSMLS